jgi:hypothetical protein
LAEIRYVDIGAVRAEAVAAREAFDLAVAGDTDAAADRLQRAINDIEDQALRGWLREQKAAYLHFTDPALAQQQLGAAVRDNPVLLRPAVGVNPIQLKAAAVQARAAAAFLGENYRDGVSLVLGVRALLDEVVWDEDRTDQAEGAWQRLGLHLGFASTCPERLYGTGPDNLWALSADRHAVIELKTGCTTDTIAKKDLDQLGGSVRWDHAQYPEVTSQAVMLHPSRVIDVQGTVVPGMRIITPAKLEDLKNAVRTFSVALADGQGRWSDEQAVATQLTHARLTAGGLINTYSETPRSLR